MVQILFENEYLIERGAQVHLKKFLKKKFLKIQGIFCFQVIFYCSLR